MAAPEFLCANWPSDCTDCKRGGKYTCKGCLLVTYCSATCQKSHWPQHKSECRSPLGKKTWQPAWILENRTPSFIGNGIGEQFGAPKYLWGNVPAVDVLRLGSNEGDGYQEDLHILFAASGDLRNVIKTVAQLPSSYSRSLHVIINDRDFDNVARNFTLLLIALVVEDANKATDHIVHLWYSALVRESDIDLLHQRISPLIEEICGKIKDKAPKSLLGKTWTFGKRSLRIVLEKSSWDRLLSFVTAPVTLTAERAHEIRAAVTLAESRKDYRDRYMYCLSPAHRVAFNKFRGDGLLLPFGSTRQEFRVPNPTFFQAEDTWPMKDSADPLQGWSSEDVANTSSGAAAADIYGKLFYHIRGMLRSFLSQLSRRCLSFELLHVDAALLPDFLEENTFSRIEVSNISDGGWLGIHRTLGSMVPLLQTPLENPHACLITLFLNAVDETLTDQDKLRDMTVDSPTTKALLKYLPPTRKLSSTFDPELIKFNSGRNFLTPFDHIFDRYSKELGFCEVADLLGAAMKDNHSIIEKWPFRLKLRPGQPGAQEEFDRSVSGGMSGKERYVEWKRI
ncbi:hypothetical protein MGYG_08610 [Nannizzia gypsea CBS 118893]|uniref:MYND-type domain-containing protein n=1 Tax=Arthroderma gypseum (strain ATCC MYA-4604 / CBS 118893) TaxID=535722 RepID=E4V6H1_ARTGP|nr:hypothetical protein MGYG_08610 [Nannizzia gypsea CBS 118893]EFQ96687.1 hypothetical protein MGYG_08610 [Nannizzia gypsea CBS 118893]